MSTEAAVRSGVPAVREELPASVNVTSEGGNVRQLLQLALEKGTPVESLEKLMDLHERVAAREAAQQFIQALAAFKADLAPIVHTRKVAFTTRGGAQTNYSYTELDELARHIDPGLTKHGFSYSWNQKLEGQIVTTTCTLFHVGGHSRDASFTLPAQNESAASPQQKIGMADTYAARRSLIAVLGLTTADTAPAAGMKEVDPTPITEDQSIQIDDLITETQADLPKFLKYMNVNAVAEIPAARFTEAVAALKQIGAERAKKKAGAR